VNLGESFSNEATTIPSEGSILVSFRAICPSRAGVRGKRGPRDDCPAAEFSKFCHFFVYALLPSGSLDGCTSLFVGTRDDIIVDCRRGFSGSSCEGHVQSFDGGLILDVFWSTRYYKIDVGDALNVRTADSRRPPDTTTTTLKPMRDADGDSALCRYNERADTAPPHLCSTPASSDAEALNSRRRRNERAELPSNHRSGCVQGW
jgi:hypothetical protein